MGLGPILAPQPQMVTPNEALPTRANIRIPIIISQFEGLIHPAVTVSQVGRLRRPQVGPKAFFSTGLGIRIRPQNVNYMLINELTIRLRLQSAQSRHLRGPTQSSAPR
jgi:hypothetical protein